MKNSDMMLAAISAGDATDKTVSAALDALREDASCDLIGAVLCVARTWKAGCDARELTRATAAIAEGARFRGAILTRITERSRPYYPSAMTVIVMEGTDAPAFHYDDPEHEGGYFGPCTVTVGARWVLNVLAEVEDAAEAARRARGYPRLKK